MLSNDEHLRFVAAGLLLVASSLLASLGIASTSTPIDRAGMSPTALPVGTWAIVPSPAAGSGRYLKSVGCTSAQNCWAVGYTLEAVNQGFVIHWDGVSWSDVQSPHFAITAHLESVVCSSESDCWAVGYRRDTGFPFNKYTLVEHWDGIAWTVTNSPNPSPSVNYLFAVTCVSSDDCWAAGLYGDGVLTLHWNGHSWDPVTAPNPGTSTPFISGVTCVSGSDCWLAGYYYPDESSNNTQTLVEHWNGTNWAITQSPNLSSTNSQLEAVSCVSSSLCWAVGYGTTGTNANNRTLIEQWNGNTWTIVSSPNAGETVPNILTGISCPSASNCWVVGSTDFSGPNSTTFLQHWNGSTWSIVSSPDLNSSHYGLYAVACPSDAYCRATGWFYDEAGILQALAEHFTATAPQIMSISRVANAFTLLGHTGPSLKLQIKASSDVITEFENVGSVTSDESGNFEFQDSDPGLKRFYRVVLP